MSNLKRISIIPNPACERAGMKQYASILKEYDFAPTTEGPSQMVDIATKNLKNLFKPTDKKATKPLLRKVEDDKPGEVKAEVQQNDALYICPVEIGTPSQIMNLHFDTGSSNIWMWSTELDRETKEARVKSKHNVFDAKASSMFKKIDGASWRIRYGDGESNHSSTVVRSLLSVCLSWRVFMRFLMREGRGLGLCRGWKGYKMLLCLSDHSRY
jgi:hypothetical protein